MGASDRVEAKAALLDTLVDLIIEAADPDRIILFGSRATGTARPERDDDVLVVVPHVENERRVSCCIDHALRDHPIEAAVDIVVVDRETLAQHQDTPGMIDRQAQGVRFNFRAILQFWAVYDSSALFRLSQNCQGLFQNGRKLRLMACSY